MAKAAKAAHVNQIPLHGYKDVALVQPLQSPPEEDPLFVLNEGPGLKNHRFLVRTRTGRVDIVPAVKPDALDDVGDLVGVVANGTVAGVAPLDVPTS